jgi:hypothetical protein
MTLIAPEQARAYIARWTALARHEAAELRATTVARRARQLDALFASRALFPVGQEVEREAAALTERWCRIRAASGV